VVMSVIVIVIVVVIARSRVRAFARSVVGCCVVVTMSAIVMVVMMPALRHGPMFPRHESTRNSRTRERANART